MSAPQDFSALLNEIAFLRVQQEQRTKRREAESAFSDAIASAELTGLEGQVKVGETAAKQEQKQQQERQRARAQGKPAPSVGETFPIGPETPGTPERSFLDIALAQPAIQGAAGGTAVQQFANQRPQGVPQAAAAGGVPGAGAPGVTTTTRGQIARSFGTGTSLIPTTTTQTQTGISQAQLGQLQIQRQAQQRLRNAAVLDSAVDISRTHNVSVGEAFKASSAAINGDFETADAILDGVGLRQSEKDDALIDLYKANAKASRASAFKSQTEADILLQESGLGGAAGLGAAAVGDLERVTDDLKTGVFDKKTGDIIPGAGRAIFQGAQMRLFRRNLLLIHTPGVGTFLGLVLPGSKGTVHLTKAKPIFQALATLNGRFRISEVNPDGSTRTPKQLVAADAIIRREAEKVLVETGIYQSSGGRLITKRNAAGQDELVPTEFNRQLEGVVANADDTFQQYFEVFGRNPRIDLTVDPQVIALMAAELEKERLATEAAAAPTRGVAAVIERRRRERAAPPRELLKGLFEFTGPKGTRGGR